MEWIGIALIVVGALIIISILIKLILHRKIKNIDGVIGIQNSDENIIGDAGEQHHKKK